MSELTTEYIDRVIIGAGISGIGMAYNMLKKRPQDSFTVIESRENFGGTWDLFKYPGIRSDSDMYTFAYSFKPWRHREYIGSADRIMGYLDELVKENQIDQKIRFNTRIIKAEWDSAINKWTLLARKGDGELYRIQCSFLMSCTGYYNYEKGYLPKFKGYDDFDGDIIHPQKWPENYDYSGKKVVVIGSGATAFTVVPSMAEKAAHVTMIQRSPGYVYNRPAADGLFRFLSSVLPARLTNDIMRFKYVCLQQFGYALSKLFPNFARNLFIKSVAKACDNKLDANVDFSPDYKPWDQRVCMVPDNDMFEAVKQGDVSIKTAEIAQFSKTGVVLKSGEEVPADLIVTATGLDLQLLGGMEVLVDGHKVNTASLTNYKGMMFSQLPNMVMIFGYTNSSWTLKAELTYDYVCRLLNHMEDNKHQSVFPYLADDVETEQLVGLTSGYILRAADKLPSQGRAFPWRNKDFYFADLFAIKGSKLIDGVLRFDDNDCLADFHEKANIKKSHSDKKAA